MGKVARLVSHVRHSTSASDLFVDVNRLLSANVTRWNSQLTMLKSLLKVYDSPPMQALNYGGKLNLYEINIVTDIVEILTPFKWATDLAQAEKKVTASIVLPVIRAL